MSKFLCWNCQCHYENRDNDGETEKLCDSCLRSHNIVVKRRKTQEVAVAPIKKVNNDEL